MSRKIRNVQRKIERSNQDWESGEVPTLDEIAIASYTFFYNNDLNDEYSQRPFKEATSVSTDCEDELEDLIDDEEEAIDIVSFNKSYERWAYNRWGVPSALDSTPGTEGAEWWLCDSTYNLLDAYCPVDL